LRLLRDHAQATTATNATPSKISITMMITTAAHVSTGRQTHVGA
jgi:hypothetical protein